MSILLVRYLRWHFGKQTRKILRGWKNFLAFGVYFFSITLLLKTLFSPWRRISWSAGRGFDLWEQFLVLFSNLFSRLLGAMVRIPVILMGIFFELLVLAFGAGLFLLWLVLPLLLIFCFILGLILSF